MSFANLAQQSADAFSDLGVCHRPLPDDIADITAGKDVQIINRFATIADLYELRCVYISSAKIDIASIYLWPDPARDLPTYVLELVMLGETPIVGVMDVNHLGQSDSPCHLMQSVKTQFPTFENSEDQPEWFQACRSSDYVFLRPTSAQTLTQLSQAHVYAMHELAQALSTKGAAAVKCAGQHENAQRQYKEHHRVHAPGLNLMNATFGEPWTQRYMAEYLFA